MDQSPYHCLGNSPLSFLLTPSAISILFFKDFVSFEVQETSLINEGQVCSGDELFAKRDGDHVRLVREEPEELYKGEKVTVVRHVLEMKVGAVYLHADMGSLWGDEYNSVLEKGLRRQAEEAFMRTAALIGVAASKEVIVHAKT